jgi:hypothetical protein
VFGVFGVEMKTKTNLLIDLSILVAFLIAFEPAITGIEIHEWLGLAFFFTLLIHLILHWRWVVNTTVRLFTKMSLRNRINYMVDFVIFISFIALNLSGLMISKFVLQKLGIILPHGGTWKQIHALAADVTVYLVSLHFALHWNWVAAMIKNHLIQPIQRLLTPSNKLAPRPVEIDRN